MRKGFGIIFMIIGGVDMVMSIVTLFAPETASQYHELVIRTLILGAILVALGHWMYDSAKSKKKATIENLNGSKTPCGIHSQIKNLNDELDKRKVLLDLKQQKLLTDKEYVEKLALIEIQEESLYIQQQKENLEKIIDQRIEASIVQFKPLMEAGLYTEEELKLKKEELRLKYSTEVQIDLANNNLPLESHIETISRTKLTAVEMSGVANKLELCQPGDVILKSKKTRMIYICSQTRFKDILASGKADKYILIQK